MVPNAGPQWGSGDGDIITRMPLEVRETIYYSLYAYNRCDLLRLALTCSQRHNDIFNKEYPLDIINAGLDRQVFRLRIGNGYKSASFEGEAPEGNNISTRRFFPDKRQVHDESVMLDWVGIGLNDKDRLVSIKSLRGLKDIHVEIPAYWVQLYSCNGKHRLMDALGVLFNHLSVFASSNGPVVTVQTREEPCQVWLGGCSLKVAVTVAEETVKECDLMRSLLEVTCYARYNCHEQLRPNICTVPWRMHRSLRRLLEDLNECLLSRLEVDRARSRI